MTCGFSFSEVLSTYDDLDSDVIKNYSEFSLASLLFYGMKEGACSEQSSRMTSMDAASKNAGKYFNDINHFISQFSQWGSLFQAFS